LIYSEKITDCPINSKELLRKKESIPDVHNYSIASNILFDLTGLRKELNISLIIAYA
jgi:hypothetical protein